MLHWSSWSHLPCLDKHSAWTSPVCYTGHLGHIFPVWTNIQLGHPRCVTLVILVTSSLSGQTFSLDIPGVLHWSSWSHLPCLDKHSAWTSPMCYTDHLGHIFPVWTNIQLGHPPMCYTGHLGHIFPVWTNIQLGHPRCVTLVILVTSSLSGQTFSLDIPGVLHWSSWSHLPCLDKHSAWTSPVCYTGHLGHIFPVWTNIQLGHPRCVTLVILVTSSLSGQTFSLDIPGVLHWSSWSHLPCLDKHSAWTSPVCYTGHLGHIFPVWTNIQLGHIRCVTLVILVTSSLSGQTFSLDIPGVLHWSSWSHLPCLDKHSAWTSPVCYTGHLGHIFPVWTNIQLGHPRCVTLVILVTSSLSGQTFSLDIPGVLHWSSWSHLPCLDKHSAWTSPVCYTDHLGHIFPVWTNIQLGHPPMCYTDHLGHIFPVWTNIQFGHPPMCYTGHLGHIFPVWTNIQLGHLRCVTLIILVTSSLSGQTFSSDTLRCVTLVILVTSSLSGQTFSLDIPGVLHWSSWSHLPCLDKHSAWTSPVCYTGHLGHIFPVWTNIQLGHPRCVTLVILVTSSLSGQTFSLDISDVLH